MSGSRFNDLSAEALEKELDDLYKQRFRLTIQKQMKVLEKTHLIRILRRDIARAKTALTLKRKQALA